MKNSSAQLVQAPSRLYASWWLIRFISKRSCSSSHEVASSAWMMVPFSHAGCNELMGCASVLNTAGTPIAVALPHDNDDLALAGSVFAASDGPCGRP